jgi:hypothetical protein
MCARARERFSHQCKRKKKMAEIMVLGVIIFGSWIRYEGMRILLSSEI